MVFGKFSKFRSSINASTIGYYVKKIAEEERLVLIPFISDFKEVSFNRCIKIRKSDNCRRVGLFPGKVIPRAFGDFPTHQYFSCGVSDLLILPNFFRHWIDSLWCRTLWHHRDDTTERINSMPEEIWWLLISHYQTQKTIVQLNKSTRQQSHIAFLAEAYVKNS